MANIKPLKLYSHAGGPNPPKVLIILKELGLPYEQEFMDFGTTKQEPFISINPNGKVPALDDPNTGIITWESGACIDYLLEQYDKENKLSYTSGEEKWLQAAWKFQQVSGQGPYFGQAAWFQFFHSEKGLTSVIERYKAEIRRIFAVFDAHLTKTGKPYLVGDKVTAADLMFVPWNHNVIGLLGEGSAEELEKTVPRAWAWRQSLEDRESVKETFAEMAKAQEGQKGH